MQKEQKAPSQMLSLDKTELFVVTDCWLTSGNAAARRKRHDGTVVHLYLRTSCENRN